LEIVDILIERKHIKLNIQSNRTWLMFTLKIYSEDRNVLERCVSDIEQTYNSCLTCNVNMSTSVTLNYILLIIDFFYCYLCTSLLKFAGNY